MSGEVKLYIAIDGGDCYNHVEADPSDLRAAVVPLLDLEAAVATFLRRPQGEDIEDTLVHVLYAALGLGEPTSQGGEK